MIPVKDRPNWYREGNAVINTDMDAYNAYMKKKNSVTSQQAEMESMKASINKLDKAFADLDGKLTTILNLLQK